MGARVSPCDSAAFVWEPSLRAWDEAVSLRFCGLRWDEAVSLRFCEWEAFPADTGWGGEIGMSAAPSKPPPGRPDGG